MTLQRKQIQVYFSSVRTNWICKTKVLFHWNVCFSDFIFTFCHFVFICNFTIVIMILLSAHFDTLWRIIRIWFLVTDWALYTNDFSVDIQTACVTFEGTFDALRKRSLKLIIIVALGTNDFIVLVDLTILTSFRTFHTLEIDGFEVRSIQTRRTNHIIVCIRITFDTVFGTFLA